MCLIARRYAIDIVIVIVVVVVVADFALILITKFSHRKYNYNARVYGRRRQPE